jgi:hypothetical protein
MLFGCGNQHGMAAQQRQGASHDVGRELVNKPVGEILQHQILEGEAIVCTEN